MIQSRPHASQDAISGTVLVHHTRSPARDLLFVDWRFNQDDTFNDACQTIDRYLMKFSF
jgi:hypothetical protein